MGATVDAKTKFESYRLGIDDIDEQHRALFDYIENLDAAIASGDRWLVVYQTLVELEHWSKLHFAVEESLMRICHYPQLKQHHNRHAAFSASVEQMKQEALTKDISKKVSKFLHLFLRRHVKTDDRKYAEYFLAISECFAPGQCLVRPAWQISLFGIRLTYQKSRIKKLTMCADVDPDCGEYENHDNREVLV